MKRSLASIILIVAVLAVLTIVYTKMQPKQQTTVHSALKLHSTAFADGGNIPVKYTCNGQDISPPLGIFEVPKGTRELAFSLVDAEAHFTHWLVWGMPRTTQSLEADTLPAGAVIGTNDFGKNHYNGPCPPSGTHHYVFKMYALSQPLNLPPNTTAPAFNLAVRQKSIAEAELTGLYSKH